MSVVMETSKPPLMTSESNLYNSSAGPKTNASNPSLNSINDFVTILIEEILYISIISSIEIPMICLAIYAVYFIFKSNQATPVFLINLLISDLITIVSMLLAVFSYKMIIRIISWIAMYWSGITGLYLMTCIAVERYVLIAHPVWHRSHRSVKCLVCTSLMGWIVSFIGLFMLSIDKTGLVFLLGFIPYPVIIFCFVGACRSLSRSMSLTPLKKQLVLAPLLFVVISYTFLFLPVNISCILVRKFSKTFTRLAFNLFLLNPLVDCLLYVFMRSDAENIIRTSPCCARLKRVQRETGHTTSTNIQHV